MLKNNKQRNYQPRFDRIKQERKKTLSFKHEPENYWVNAVNSSVQTVDKNNINVVLIV